MRRFELIAPCHFGMESVLNFVHKKSGAFAGMPLFTYFWNAYIMFLCLIEIRRNE